MKEKLFGNIGGKLKTLALILFWLILLVGVIGGLIFAVIDDGIVGIGLGIAVGSAIMSWLSALPLYAFGQLVENSDKIKEALEKNGTNTENSVIVKKENVQPSEKEEKAKVLKTWLDANLITEEEYNEKMAKL